MAFIKYELMHLCDSAYLLAAFNITMNYCFRMANIILPGASSFSSSMKNNTDGLPQDNVHNFRNVLYKNAKHLDGNSAIVSVCLDFTVLILIAIFFYSFR